eukprot:PhM_4_TR8438/c1_g1_i4/m.3986
MHRLSTSSSMFVRRRSVVDIPDFRRGQRTIWYTRSLWDVFRDEYGDALRCIRSVVAYSLACIVVILGHSIPAMIFAYLPFERDYTGSIYDKPVKEIMPYFIFNYIVPTIVIP